MAWNGSTGTIGTALRFGQHLVRVKAELLDRIAEESMHDRWIHTNPRKIDGPRVVRELLDAAW